MEKEGFLKKLDQIREVSTLPAILAKVNQVLGDENASVAKLSQVIETDQAITAKILKLVNSAFYGFRSKISGIRHALVLLGFNSVRNAVISISVFESFSKKGGNGLEVDHLWKHSLSVAVISKFLAIKTRVTSPEDSFVAGLLHDIGKIILAQNFGETFSAVLAAMREKRRSFSEVEKELVPLDHAQIGGYFASKWQFPPDLVEAIRYHHLLANAKGNPGFPVTVRLADEISHKGGSSFKMSPEIEQVAPDISNILGSCLEALAEWYPLASNEIEWASQFFLKEER